MSCIKYEWEGGDSEESNGDIPPGPHDWYEFDYGEETFFATRTDGGIYSNPLDFIKWSKSFAFFFSSGFIKWGLYSTY